MAYRPNGGKEGNMNNTDKARELAQRIYDYTAPWDRDDETVEDIINDINTDPLAVIEYLLGIVEEV